MPSGPNRLSMLSMRDISSSVKEPNSSLNEDKLVSTPGKLSDNEEMVASKSPRPSGAISSSRFILSKLSLIEDTLSNIPSISISLVEGSAKSNFIAPNSLFKAPTSSIKPVN